MRALRAGVDNACLRVHLHRGEDAVRKCGGGAGRRIGCYCKLGAPPANTAQYVQDFNRQLASPDAARVQPRRGSRCTIRSGRQLEPPAAHTMQRHAAGTWRYRDLDATLRLWVASRSRLVHRVGVGLR